MQLVTTVTSKGQVVIPKVLRDQFLIKPFDRMVFKTADNKIIVEPVPTVSEMVGFIRTNKHFTEADFEKAIEEGATE